MDVDELARLHRRACTDWAARLRLPGWEQLGRRCRPPLDDHTIGELIVEVSLGNRRTAVIADPAQFSAFPASMVDWCPRDDELVEGAYSATRAALVAVARARESGTLEGDIHEDWLWGRVASLTVHGWDLQQAIWAGADIDPILCEQLLAYPGPLQVWPRAEPIEPSMKGPAARLLARFGRRLEPRGAPQDGRRMGDG